MVLTMGFVRPFRIAKAHLPHISVSQSTSNLK